MDGRAGDDLPRRDVYQPAFVSHLSNVGLTETIARDLDEYVELAVSLAGDLPRLAGCGRACGSGWPPRRFATGSDLPRTWRQYCAACGKSE